MLVVSYEVYAARTARHTPQNVVLPTTRTSEVPVINVEQGAADTEKGMEDNQYIMGCGGRP